MLAWFWTLANKINLPAPLKFTENERNSPSHNLFKNNWTKSIYDDDVLLLSLNKLAVSPIYGVCAKLRQPSAGCSLKGPLCRIYIWSSKPSLEPVFGLSVLGYYRNMVVQDGEPKRSTAPGFEANLTKCLNRVRWFTLARKAFRSLHCEEAAVFLASQPPQSDSFHYETLSHLVQ